MPETVLTEQNFDATLKDSAFLVVDFWAEWCQPCKMIAPFLDNIAGKYPEKLSLAKVNVDDAPALAERFQVTGIPTLIVFKNGEQAGRFTGAMPQATLDAKISALF